MTTLAVTGARQQLRYMHVPCPTCGQEAARGCLSTSGRLLMVAHVARQRAAATAWEQCRRTIRRESVGQRCRVNATRILNLTDPTVWHPEATPATVYRTLELLRAVPELPREPAPLVVETERAWLVIRGRHDPHRRGAHLLLRVDYRHGLQVQLVGAAAPDDHGRTAERRRVVTDLVEEYPAGHAFAATAALHQIAEDNR